jgi:hypothetical protein
MLIAGVLAAGLIVAGCGGGDSGSSSGSNSSTGPTLTRAEFAAKANAICTETKNEVQTAAADLRSRAQNDPSQLSTVLEDFIPTVAPMIRRGIDQISALSPPEDLQPKFDEIKTKVNGLLDDAEADPSNALSQLTASNDEIVSLQGLANDLGLTDCGGGGG